MAGLAGIVLSLLALVDRWRAPDNLDARYNLLIVAAILLSLSFVLAPFVRRAFVPSQQRDRRNARKTLLDELREHPERDGSEATSISPPLADERAKEQAPRVLTRVILALYAVFGTTLAMVVMALR